MTILLEQFHVVALGAGIGQHVSERHVHSGTQAGSCRSGGYLPAAIIESEPDTRTAGFLKPCFFTLATNSLIELQPNWLSHGGSTGK